MIMSVNLWTKDRLRLAQFVWFNILFLINESQLLRILFEYVMTVERLLLKASM